ncbi:uncharacterized protein V1510DRAFT_404713 [Dipodascopsis tothii]|uniref:uncharacterized protein n=1 Tax=Dipodascopsis tothii TaxID=44089 RepID=UPI0034CF5804
MSAQVPANDASPPTDATGGAAAAAIAPARPSSQPTKSAPSAGPGGRAGLSEAAAAAAALLPPYFPPLQGGYVAEGGLRPPSYDEVVRTIFIGAIPDELSDFWFTRLVRMAGNVRGLVVVKDSLGHRKNYAFAEYEDANTIAAAVHLLRDVEFAVADVEEGEEAEGAGADGKGAGGATTAHKLRVMLSEATTELISPVLPDTSARTQDLIHAHKPTVDAVLELWRDPDSRAYYEALHKDEDVVEDEDERRLAASEAAAARALAATEDEMADIPEEQRELVAREIANFRNRSSQREKERILKEEEYERHRLARLEAEKKSIEGVVPAVAGRRGSSSLPSYLQDPIKFAKGSDDRPLRRRPDNDDDDKDDTPDEVLEERRREQREDDLEQQFIERERKWLYKEKARIADVERDMRRERDDGDRHHKDSRRSHRHDRGGDPSEDLDYDGRSETHSLRSRSRSRYSRSPRSPRRRHRRDDSSDDDRVSSSKAAAMADSFLDQLGDGKERKPISIGIAKPAAPKFKMALGTAKKPAVVQPEKKAPSRVLGDDDDEDTEKKRRVLIPLSYDK